METVRLRLVFNDHRHLLNKSQKTEGLKRSWLLLKPEIETILDLESHLTYTFDLHESCPNGLLLSMDGFVLPSFESTRIFKDKDIIRVKKKAGFWADVIRNGNQENSHEDSEIVGKQPVLSGVELLALDEFEKESGGYQSEPEESKSDSPGDAFCLETPSSGKTISKKRKSSKKTEESKSDSPGDAFGLETPSSGKSISKKRKSSKKLQSAKKRIKCSSPQKDPKVPVEGVENDVHTEPEEGCHRKGVLSDKSHKKKRSSKKTVKLKTVSSTQVDDRVENITESMLSEDSYGQLQKNGTTNLEVSPVSEGMKKLPSRSARRKKAKRKWLRELANSQNKETIQNNLPAKLMHRKSPEPLLTDQNTDKEDEIVPIVIRPGHIRFEPLDEVNKKNSWMKLSPWHVVQEFFQWNGTTSKKKGQKWGKEKTSVSRSNDYKDSREDTVEKPTIEEGEHVHSTIDFEKLKPLSGFPKEGDVVAYRVVELSSSWCPELSSFRVGKVSCCNSESNKVVLVPVPEYPIVSDEKNDESDTLQVDPSLYRDDGSLEIDFPALHDVRIVKHDRSDAATVVTGGCDEAAVTTKESVPGSGLNDDNADTNRRTIENGGPVNAWEEISQALIEKKTQLLQKDGWTKKEGSGRSSWSYRALRSSALGPTIALLRAGNGTSV
ncbi:Coilin [Macleaya cordata]|uniref:Coilin n=1 Tax=Macleaya cordata TaxID=56857 RepID=A0A200RDQ2_MACCD|nr:Coilin [Macleaya cordata]